MSSSGLLKPKKYDWKDSNLELFGSDTEKAVKKSSADSENAWSPVKTVDSSQLFIWRIEKFKVKAWPREEYGRFYSGDSYIVLNCWKEPSSNRINYDAHFWIGKRSTQDEYGTAAYKTVELDTFLDDMAIQHREVQGYESDLFKSYFPIITILKGGCDSGFRSVQLDVYKPRLLHFASSGPRHVEVTEVRFSRQALTSGDVFILDSGKEAWQWNGNTSNKDEKIKAAQFLQSLESERCGRCTTTVFDETDLSPDHRFYQALPDIPVKKHEIAGAEFPKSLFRLSDSSGKLQFTLISENTAPKSMLESHDVYIIDSGKKMFVYIGGDASKDEKKNAITYAHEYLKTTSHPNVPVTILGANQHSKELDEILD